MKYKVIKEFPSCFRDYKVGDIVDTDLEIFIKCKLYPEFFEKIPEKLFTTEDGLDIYKGDSCFAVNRTTYLIQHGDYYVDSSKVLIYFANMQNAEKWIDENKPMYSKKEILNAINYANTLTCISGGNWDHTFLAYLNIK